MRANDFSRLLASPPVNLPASAGSSLVLSLGCESKPQQQQQSQQSVSVTVSKPVILPLVEWDEYTGRLDAIDFVEVQALVSGYLQETYFIEGQIVKKGDLLAIIDPRPFDAELTASKARKLESQARLTEAKSLLKQADAELANVKAQLTLADNRLKRSKALASKNVITQEELEVSVSEQLQATAALESAIAQVESAKARIATAIASIETASANVEAAKLDVLHTQIRAPISGRISRRLVSPGNLISGGTGQSTLLTTIVSQDPIHVYFDANEQEFLKYSRLAREGKRESSRDAKNPVRMALIDEEGFPHRGHMDFVDNRIDPNTGTMRGRAIFKNDDNRLTPGLFAKVRLPGSGRYDAILIPDSAIGSDQADRFVYAVNDKNEVERKVISLGPISHGLRIVRSGLDGTETIITRGLQRIFPGVTIEPTEEKIEAKESELPDDYVPVPKAEWLSKKPEQIPDGVKSNDALYKKPIEENVEKIQPKDVDAKEEEK